MADTITASIRWLLIVNLDVSDLFQPVYKYTIVPLRKSSVSSMFSCKGKSTYVLPSLPFDVTSVISTVLDSKFKFAAYTTHFKFEFMCIVQCGA